MSYEQPSVDARELARFNMIEQQIRTWEVLDAKVLDLLKQVPREAFVPKEYEGLAFADIEIPIGHGQTMLSPKLEGRILQALQIKPTEKVLEIGTGSGYLTCLMAKMAKHVYSVEIDPQLAHTAELKIKQQGISNVTIDIGNAASGWAAEQPYDVIVFTGALEIEPAEQIINSLTANGRLFAVIGHVPVMQATMYQRIGNSLKKDVLFETCLPTLSQAPEAQRFEF